MKPNYTVIWWEDAVNELTEIWMQSPNPRQFSEEVDAVENDLKYRPETVGVELVEGNRFLELSELILYFKVKELDRVVEVTRIRLLA